MAVMITKTNNIPTNISPIFLILASSYVVVIRKLALSVEQLAIAVQPEI